MWMIRKSMQDSHEFTERFLKRLKATKTNEQFLDDIGEEIKMKRNQRS